MSATWAMDRRNARTIINPISDPPMRNSRSPCRQKCARQSEDCRQADRRQGTRLQDRRWRPGKGDAEQAKMKAERTSEDQQQCRTPCDNSCLVEDANHHLFAPCAHRPEQADFAATFLLDRREQQRHQNCEPDQVECREHCDTDEQQVQCLSGGSQDAVAFDRLDIGQLGQRKFDVFDTGARQELQQKGGYPSSAKDRTPAASTVIVLVTPAKEPGGRPCAIQPTAK